jgi:Outer membrane protein beta-barrel domain
MKKILLTFLLIGVIITNAQTITTGLKGGINISNFKGDLYNSSNTEKIIGFHAGGFLNFKLGKISLQTELLVSSAGAKLTDLQESENLKITYIALPVMIRIQPFKKGFYFEAGPQASFKVSEKVSNTNLQNFINTIDLSLALGIGYQSKNGFGIGGRYLAGLSRVANFDDNTAPNFKNGIIQAGISYCFRKK